MTPLRRVTTQESEAPLHPCWFLVAVVSCATFFSALAVALALFG
jgi:hypothetical protein